MKRNIDFIGAQRRARRSRGGRDQRDRLVLPDGAHGAARADDRAGDARHHHRQPGGDHRRLFAHASGDRAGAAAAHAYPPDVGRPDRPDLHAGDQLGAAVAGDDFIKQAQVNACCCNSINSCRVGC